MTDEKDKSEAQRTDAPLAEGPSYVRRLIPSVAAVGLTMGGAACGGNGQERPDFDGFCQDYRECVGPDEFEQAFDSLGDCIDAYENYFNYYLNVADDYDGDCVDAARTYLVCSYESTYCVNETFYYGEDCEEEYDSFSAACQ